MKSDESIKQSTLNLVANGQSWRTAGRAKYRVGRHIVHVRYCSPSSSDNSHYKFNINPNTLDADFELWICGQAETYYLIPTSVMRKVYEDPDAYPDNLHPQIRVVSVDIAKDKMTYATGGKFINLAEYYKRTL